MRVSFRIGVVVAAGLKPAMHKTACEALRNLPSVKTQGLAGNPNAIKAVSCFAERRNPRERLQA
jgi:hypothetical protein